MWEEQEEPTRTTYDCHWKSLELGRDVEFKSVVVAIQCTYFFPNLQNRFLSYKECGTLQIPQPLIIHVQAFCNITQQPQSRGHPLPPSCGRVIHICGWSPWKCHCCTVNLLALRITSIYVFIHSEFTIQVMQFI